MVALGIPNAQLYRCHDLRRGHALDLQLSGALPCALLLVDCFGSK